MFERFTVGARTTVVVGQDSARSLGHRHIGTEHLLLGLVRDADEISGRVLAAAGVTYERIVEDIRRRERAALEPDPDLVAKDAAALATIGIDLDAVRAAVEDSFGPGAMDTGTAHEDGEGPWWRRRQIQRQRLYRQNPASQAQAGGGSPKGHIPFTPRAKKVLELSLREATALKHSYIGTEHVLLGLLREGQGLAVKILRDEGVPLDQLREQVLAELQRAA